MLAVFSILYGSVLAFSQDNVAAGRRLLVDRPARLHHARDLLARRQGRPGRVLQMVNHGLVVVPLFFIIGALAARAGGSESLRELGGIALRAPVLAALFLITTFATLAMPGSANFVGELLILFGTFEDKLVVRRSWPASGVVLAAVYMIRLFQRTMHNRVGAGGRVARAVPARPRGDRAARGGDRRARRSTRSSCSSAPRRRPWRRSEPRRRQVAADGRPGGIGDPMTFRSPTSPAPEIDYKALSPLIATVGGSIVVLMVGLLRPPLRARDARAGPDGASRCSPRSASSIWVWEPGDTEPIVEGALAVDTLALGDLDARSTSPGSSPSCSRCARGAARRGRPRRVLLAAARLDHRHGRAGRRPRT